MTRGIVFAYHDVGVRCLSVLLAHGIEVPLVITHRDDAAERIWFASVAELAGLHGIPVITPDDPNDSTVFERIAALHPDFLFSFYYRHMIKPYLLALPSRGAYNLHGSLLPKYRGRVPVNWAVIKGERETGATLHQMVAKPDAGSIVDQMAVPILPDDSASEVFNKVTVAAEIVLDRALPGLVAGTAPHRVQNLAYGSYFSGRKPEDGRIDWRDSAHNIHNLIRGVAPPYPGAFTDIGAARLRILKSLPAAAGRRPQPGGPGLYVDPDGFWADCGDGKVLRLLQLELDAAPLAPEAFVERYGAKKVSVS